MSPALAGRFSTTAPPGKPNINIFNHYSKTPEGPGGGGGDLTIKVLYYDAVVTVQARQYRRSGLPWPRARSRLKQGASHVV